MENALVTGRTDAEMAPMSFLRLGTLLKRRNTLKQRNMRMTVTPGMSGIAWNVQAQLNIQKRLCRE